MATKTTPKQSIEPSAATNEQTRIAPEINLEDAIADELLDSLDWSKVKAAMLTKAKARFWHWLTSSHNTPVNISQFPELSALPSSQDGEAA